MAEKNGMTFIVHKEGSFTLEVTENLLYRSLLVRNDRGEEKPLCTRQFTMSM